MNRDLAYPRALLPSGGPLSREFQQLTTPLTERQAVCPGPADWFTITNIKEELAVPVVRGDTDPR